MITVNDKNRNEIIAQYVNQLIDTMEWGDMLQFIEEKLLESKDLMDNEALENEIRDYCPNLLEN